MIQGVSLVQNFNTRNNSLSFKANENTRLILEQAEIEEDEYISNGKPKTLPLDSAKKSWLSRYKKRRGDSVKFIYKSCKRKVRYEDEIHAEKAARHAEQDRDVSLSVYPCPICKGWHICKDENKISGGIEFYY